MGLGKLAGDLWRWGQSKLQARRDEKIYQERAADFAERNPDSHIPERDLRLILHPQNKPIAIWADSTLEQYVDRELLPCADVQVTKVEVHYRAAVADPYETPESVDAVVTQDNRVVYTGMFRQNNPIAQERQHPLTAIWDTYTRGAMVNDPPPVEERDTKTQEAMQRLTRYRARKNVHGQSAVEYAGGAYTLAEIPRERADDRRSSETSGRGGQARVYVRTTSITIRRM